MIKVKRNDEYLEYVYWNIGKWYFEFQLRSAEDGETLHIGFQIIERDNPGLGRTLIHWTFYCQEGDERG
jgi:hypothetical protein